MVYKRAKQKVRRVYSRSKSILGGDLLKNPYIVGLAAGAAKNALAGKKIIDIENIKNRISKMDGTNPLILFGLGVLTKNPIITAIGMFGIVDPQMKKKKKNYIDIQTSEKVKKIQNIQMSEKMKNYQNIRMSEKLKKQRLKKDVCIKIIS